MRAIYLLSAAMAALAASGPASAAANRLLQQPALSRDLVAFVNAGDIWIAPRGGGRATRLTIGRRRRERADLLAGWADDRLHRRI